jgi:hypothetical protein
MDRQWDVPRGSSIELNEESSSRICPKVQPSGTGIPPYVLDDPACACENRWFLERLNDGFATLTLKAKGNETIDATGLDVNGEWAYAGFHIRVDLRICSALSCERWPDSVHPV